MDRLPRYLVTLAILAISANLAAPTDQGRPTVNGVASLDDLSSHDPMTRMAAFTDLVRSREHQIRRLAEIASSEDADEVKTPAEKYYSPKRMAISCLGQFRADDEVTMRILWENIAYEVEPPAGTLNQILDPGTRYPAAASLVRIGKPACERIWAELKSTHDPVRRDLAIYVLTRIEGPELSQRLVEERLQKLATMQESKVNPTPEKENLHRAREWIIERAKEASSGGRPPTIGE